MVRWHCQLQTAIDIVDVDTAAGGTSKDLPFGTVVHTYTLGNIHDHLSGQPDKRGHSLPSA